MNGCCAHLHAIANWKSWAFDRALVLSARDGRRRLPIQPGAVLEPGRCGRAVPGVQQNFGPLENCWTRPRPPFVIRLLLVAPDRPARSPPAMLPGALARTRARASLLARVRSECAGRPRQRTPPPLTADVAARRFARRLIRRRLDPGVGCAGRCCVTPARRTVGCSTPPRRTWTRWPPATTNAPAHGGRGALRPGPPDSTKAIGSRVGCAGRCCVTPARRTVGLPARDPGWARRRPRTA